jgi:hypothetical protein
LTHKKQSLFTEPGHIAALCALVVLGPCAVLLPLTQAHLIMERGKQIALSQISARAGVLSDDLEARAVKSDDAAGVEKTSAALRREAELFQAVAMADTWPVKTRDVSAFPIGFLTPVWIALAGELAKWLAKKYSPEELSATTSK